MSDPVTVALTIAVVLILVVVVSLLFTTERRRHQPARGNADALHLLLEGRRDEARAVMTDLIRDDRATPAIYLQMGNLLREEGQPERALSLHQGLLARSELANDLRRLAELATADDLLALGRAEDAQRRLEQIDRHVLDAELLQRHALALHRLGRYEDAAGKLEERAKIGGPEATQQAAAYLSEMAREALREGRYNTARDFVRRALRLDNSTVAAYEVDGDRLMAEGHPEDAVEVWKEGLRQSPAGSRTFLPRLAEAAFRAGRLDVLMEDLERERAKRPDDPALWRAVADLRLRRGDLESFFALVESPPFDGAAELSAWAGWVRHLSASGDPVPLARLLKSMPETLATYRYRCSECGYIDGEARQACPGCGTLSALTPEVDPGGSTTNHPALSETSS